MVTTLLIVVLVSLGIVFLWGLISPRTLWRAFSSWSYADPHLNEPSGIGYGLYRVVSLVGITALVVSVALVNYERVLGQPPPPKPPTAAELLWGSPEPVVVNRVVVGSTSAPAGLMDQPILGFQGMDGATRQPPYLFSLANFDQPEAIKANGLIGTEPSVGLVALDTAQLVVHVAGARGCFPHAAVVQESEDAVSIAILYGRAMPDAANPPANLADCKVDAGDKSVSTIIPISLAEPLGARTVQTLDGTPILAVGSGN